MSFRACLMAALAAGNHGPGSPVAALALDMAPDVGLALGHLLERGRSIPFPSIETVANNVVRLAAAEVARGVRRIKQ